MDIVTMIEFDDDKIIGISATDEDIKEVEKELDLFLADEYKQYVKKYGFAFTLGHEFTGISKAKRIDVVQVTKEEWELNQLVPRNLYVIEQAGIDGIVIWQDEGGIVYQTYPGCEPVMIYESMQGYVEGC